MQGGVLEQLIDLLDPLEKESRIANEPEAIRIIKENPHLLAQHSELINRITPLIAAFLNPEHCCSPELFALLLHKRTHVNAAKDCGRRAIHFLCTYNRYEYLSLLLKSRKNVDINPTTHLEQFTPLHLAAMQGSLQALEILISTGKASINSLTSRKQNALHLACFIGQKQSNVQNPSISEEVALRFEACIRILLRSGAKVDQRDEHGRTPAFYLASANIPKEIKERILILLNEEHGANLSLVDRFKQNAAALAEDYQQVDFAEMAQARVVPSLIYYCERALKASNDGSLPADIVDKLNKLRLGKGN